MRGDNGPYYYMIRKREGRTVREYWGQGDHGIIGRYCDAVDRHRSEVERADLIVARECWAAVDTAVKTVCGSCWEGAQALLQAAGYHRPNRGPWRKKRMPKRVAKETNEGGALLTPGQVAHLVPADTDGRVDFLMKIVNEERLSPHDEAVGLACVRASGRTLGLEMVGEGVKAVLILTAKNAVHRELLLIELDRNARKLAGPNPSPLVVLLVDRVLASWLLVNFYETQCAALLRARHEGMEENANWANPNRPDRWGDALHEKLGDAHKRFLSASKTLAQVQRLQVPINVQVNLAAAGGQQVNVAGSVLT